MRAQLLDGSARTMLDTVRRIGFLQIDPIATVATPQHLVLWSRLGAFDTAELDRLIWRERKLFEWNAYIWPIETLPLLQARMRSPKRHLRSREWLKANASFRRYVLRELTERGPLLSREIADHKRRAPRDEHAGGAIARSRSCSRSCTGRGRSRSSGRRNGQRVWDLAERWYPETERISLRDADRLYDEQRFRALGVRLVKGEWHAHPDVDAGPVPDRVTFLSPFDRLIHDRARARSALGLPLPARDVRPEAEARVRVLRAPRARRRPDRRTRRAAVRPQDRRPRGARRVGRHLAARRAAREPRRASRRRATIVR